MSLLIQQLDAFFIAYSYFQRNECITNDGKSMEKKKRKCRGLV